MGSRPPLLRQSNHRSTTMNSCATTQRHEHHCCRGNISSLGSERRVPDFECSQGLVLLNLVYLHCMVIDCIGFRIQTQVVFEKSISWGWKTRLTLRQERNPKKLSDQSICIRQVQYISKARTDWTHFSRTSRNSSFQILFHPVVKSTRGSYPSIGITLINIFLVELKGKWRVKREKSRWIKGNISFHLSVCV